MFSSQNKDGGTGVFEIGGRTIPRSGAGSRWLSQMLDSHAGLTAVGGVSGMITMQ